MEIIILIIKAIGEGIICGFIMSYIINIKTKEVLREYEFEKWMEESEAERKMQEDYEEYN